ncbi:MAG: competence/damage-inducible protein A [Planctomycetota bacterium]|jgi:nicotinamide-nucleotide amidase
MTLHARPTSAGVLAIGDELILGQRLDTNSRHISDQLFALGVRPVEHMTVDDDASQISNAIKRLARTCDLLVVTGGLGPTPDDLTRQALADALEEPLEQDTQARQWLEQFFARSQRTMPESNRVQALRPASTRSLHNTHGTAPGIHARLGACDVYCLPGPPSEMRPMLEREILDQIRGLAPATRVATLKCSGLAEATIAERLDDMMARDRDVLVGTTASDGIISVRLRCESPDLREQFDATINEIHRRLDPYIYADSDITIAETVLNSLRDRGETLTTAESCTGGMIASWLTDIPGSSDVFQGGWVTYTNEMKREQLGVPEDVFSGQGAVSRQCVEHMARGARRNSGASHALAISGIAGPGGGTEDKPVGTVWIAHAHPDDVVEARLFRFTGDRGQVRKRATSASLAMLLQGVNAISDAPLLWERESERA